MQALRKRKLKDGRKYDPLFPKPENKRKVLKKSATLSDTMQAIMRIARDYSFQTRKVAKGLQGSTLRETSENIWNFIYEHIQYKLDEEGKEQLRHPAEIWDERKAGGDCDDYTVMASSILLELGIAHKIRIAKYWDEWGFKKPNYQHVYVVVPIPNGGGSYYTIDPVKDKFNEEERFHKKKDFDMQLEELSGFSKSPEFSYGAAEEGELIQYHVGRINALNITAAQVKDLNRILSQMTGWAIANYSELSSTTIRMLKETGFIGREQELLARSFYKEGRSSSESRAGLGNPFSSIASSLQAKPVEVSEDVSKDIRKVNQMAQEDYARLNKLPSEDFLLIQSYLGSKISAYEPDEPRNTTSRTIRGLRATKWLTREEELVRELRKPQWRLFLERHALYIGLGGTVIGVLGVSLCVFAK